MNNQGSYAIEEFDLPGPSLEVILKCSHNYWSRFIQREVAPENTPAFCAVDPFDSDALDRNSRRTGYLGKG